MTSFILCIPVSCRLLYMKQQHICTVQHAQTHKHMMSHSTHHKLLFDVHAYNRDASRVSLNENTQIGAVRVLVRLWAFLRVIRLQPILYICCKINKRERIFSSPVMPAIPGATWVIERCPAEGCDGRQEDVRPSTRRPPVRHSDSGVCEDGGAGRGGL